MLRLIVGAITITFLAHTNVASQEADPNLGLVLNQSHTIETATKTRVDVCLDQGGSRENCVCRAQTAADIMGEKDFLAETTYIQLSAMNVGQNRPSQELQNFRNRLLDEQPDMMMRLGQALKECPSVRMKLE